MYAAEFNDCGKLCGWICTIFVKTTTEFCRALFDLEE
jgi:hypothetical protein